MSAQPGVLQRTEKKQKRKKSPGKVIVSFFSMLLCAAALISLTQIFLIQFIRVDGTSMADTLKNGEIVLVSKWDRDYRRGDVVICHYPDRVSFQADFNAAGTFSVHTIFVKRLAALPGDTVMIREGKLYVNGEMTPDPESMGSAPRDYPLRTLGEDEYFVIGDNRSTSHDSRAADVGPLSFSMLRGKVLFSLWPLSGIRAIH